MKDTLGPQLCRKHRLDGRRAALYERWLKRFTNRLLRRWAKRDPEAAPTRRRFRGYSD